MSESKPPMPDYDLRQKVQARLSRFGEGDLEAVLGPAAIAEAEAIAPSERENRDADHLELAAMLRWYRYLAQAPVTGRADLLAAIDLFARIHSVRPDAVPTPVREALESSAVAGTGTGTAEAVERNPSTFFARADVLLRHAALHPDAASYETAIEILQPCLEMLQYDNPWRPWLLSKMAIALMMRFNQVKSRAALEDMINSLRQTLAAPAEGLDQSMFRAQLARSLGWRAVASHDPGQLSEAISELQLAISELRASAPQNLPWLLELEQGLRDCEEAWTDQQAPGTAGEAMRLSNSARSLWLQSQRPPGDESLARQALDKFRRAAQLTPDWPNRASMLSNLAVALLQHGTATGSLELLEESRSLLQQAVDHSDPDAPYWIPLLANLGLVCGELYRLTRDSEMAEQAMQRLRQAIAGSPEGSPSWFGVLPDAGSVWSSVAEARRDPHVVDEVLPMLRAAAADEQHPRDRESLYRALAAALRIRGVLSGQLADLTESVSALHLALKFAGPAGRPALLANLALTLTDQYQMDNQMVVLLDAVKHGQQAIAALAPGTGAQERSILAGALRELFQRTEEEAHLDAAAELLRAAAKIAGARDPHRNRYLSNLGAVLLSAHTRRNEPELLTEAVEVLRVAVLESSPDDAELPTRLCNYANALGRSLMVGAAVPLDEAITAAQRAAGGVAPEDPARAPVLLNLALILWLALTQGYEGDVYAQACAAAREAAKIDTAIPHHRLEAFRLLGNLLASHEDWARALDAYRAAVELLPAQPARYLSRADQEYVLSRQSGVATDAAACAIRQADPAQAVQLLELGRGVILAQELESRNDLTLLRSGHPGLAGEFDRLVVQLAGNPAADPGVIMPGLEYAQLAYRRLEERKHLVRDWEGLNARIRSIDGFSRFNMPPTEADSREMAAHGPIIIINQSRYGTDALIVTADDVVSVALPAVTEEAISTMRVEMDRAQAERRKGTPAGRARSAQLLSGVLRMLWDTVASPVLGALGLAGPALSDATKPHVWWMPTGTLALLPLHAAGHHDQRARGTTVMDFVTSSYSPTLAVLRHARRTDPASTIGQPLVVAMPITPGQRPLPGADSERKMLEKRYPHATVLSSGAATRDSVLKALTHHRWAHFACHASSNIARPSESCLLLDDYQAAPLTVLDISRLHLEGASLAYLSACSTGQVSAALPDEVIHMASAFQLAGFADVIATMWPVSDPVAVRLAGNIYRWISDVHEPVAGAVDRAVQQLRDEHLDDPWLWAPFFHTGR